MPHGRTTLPPRWLIGSGLGWVLREAEEIALGVRHRRPLHVGMLAVGGGTATSMRLTVMAE